jgi:PAS domain S-box-containing protein
MNKLKITFKIKTIVGIALIETLFLFILVLNSRHILYDTIDKNINAHATSISVLLASALTDAVISKDLATIQSILETGMTIDKIFYIRVLDSDKVLAQVGNPSYRHKDFLLDEKLSDAERDGVFDVQSDIKVDDYIFGSVEVGLSSLDKEELITDATRQLSLIALIELIFVALFSFLLGIALTRRLLELQKTALSITDGEMGVQVPVVGNDEVADASRAFNLMSAKIQEVNFKLKSDSERLDAIINTATDGIFMITLDGTIQSTNNAITGLFGYSSDEVIGKNLLAFIPNLHFWDLDNSQFQKTQQSDGISKIGESVPLEIHAREMSYNNEDYIVGVVHDLTALNRLQDELSAIFKLSPDGFLIVSMDGMISYANPSLHKMMMFDNRVSLIGQNWAYFQQDLHKRLDADYHENLDFLSDLLCEKTLHLKYPAERILSCYRQKIDDKHIDSAEIVFFHDITQNTVVDKMKSEFLTTAAHELRTPLASVMGFSELLSIREYSPEKTKEIAEIINRQSISLKLLLDGLLDIASIENGTSPPINMRQTTLEFLLADCCKDFDGSDDYHYLVIEPTEFWPVLLTDQLKVRQIITNLLSNALKYSPENPKVNISTTIQINNEISEFGITVQDHGIGMTPEQLARVGERFYRADMSGHIPGTGLGIALVNEIIALLLGRLEMQSTFGEGTTMTVWFPIASKKTVSVAGDKSAINI